ncbi:MAG: alpha/beta fold hydrolase [Hamadaea sp.]|uniref:alpha/beta fold hydrolase n=1 Tax=Hamadaea sp. TaxID=2024425 RepID=UPI0017C1C0C6|nr:alpha/beta fold hydrolase [Hamadaea sp.]NUR69872.1 alpha/beta fold hydrolase [Hamadaea sp.]NUT22068.1 alpha/beta fold hydrolase [Hamadaea sp.]
MNSHTIDLAGPVHHVDFGGPSDGPAVVYVHGLGGSHLNWTRLAPLLADQVRGRALDLAGFGLTEPHGRRTSVGANAELLVRYVDEVVGEPAVLVGNSMGGMVSILAAAAAPTKVRGLVLVDPTLPLASGAHVDPVVRKQFAIHAVPGLGEWSLRRRLARVPVRDRVNYTLALCFSDPARIPPETVAAGVALEERRISQPRRAESYLAAARSILRGVGRAEHRRRMAGLSQPVLLIHGVHDRLVPIESARAAAAKHPQWTYAELDAGHTPQIEVPEQVAAQIRPWLTTF